MMDKNDMIVMIIDGAETSIRIFETFLYLFRF